MVQLSKLQIRAKVLSVISEIKTVHVFSEAVLDKFFNELSDIEDRFCLFDIFIKEFIKLDEEEYMFSACLLKQLVDVNYISDKVYEMLKSNSYNDSAKYKLVQLLRVIGNTDNYNAIPSYFENPEEVLDMETKKLLETAVFNPESMLDFLDFISAVGTSDRSILLNSLSLDYNGDVLANIIYPILYSDFEEDFILNVIKILAESKSSLAIEPFHYLIKTSDNPEIVMACQTGLKKLKLAGASPKKAEEYFKKIISDSIPAQFFTTIPDGNGNQGFLISRINALGKCLLSAVVTSQKSGIVDCFGFYNISKKELIKIIEKFYKSEGKYSVPPEYVKTQINLAIETTINLKNKFPYEFICWNPLLSDVSVLETPIQTYIGNNCKKQVISNELFDELFSKEYTLRWFISAGENSSINNLIEEFYSKDDLSADYVKDKILSSVEEIFDINTSKLWIDKFNNLIYLLLINENQKYADYFYSVVSDEKLYKKFKIFIIKKSVFNSFVTLIENSKKSVFTTNIFIKNNKENNKYDVKKLENIVELLKKNWFNG